MVNLLDREILSLRNSQSGSYLWTEKAVSINGLVPIYCPGMLTHLTKFFLYPFSLDQDFKKSMSTQVYLALELALAS